MSDIIDITVGLQEEMPFWPDSKGYRRIQSKSIQKGDTSNVSIQCFDKRSCTHQILLDAEVAILEGLNLSGVDSGVYELICLPLKLAGAEGSPVRAVLRKISMSDRSADKEA